MNLRIGWRSVIGAIIGVFLLALFLGSLAHAIWAAVKTLIFFGLLFAALLWYIEHKIRSHERNQKGEQDAV